MSFPYIAEPPLRIKCDELKGHFGRVVVRVRIIVWQILVPFRSNPEEIPTLPEPQAEIDDKQMDHCQWLFDQAEKRRTHLEQKAQSTFGLMTFLVPLLASLLVFLISKATGSGSVSRLFVMTLLTFAFVLLLLGFVSAVRAVGVKSYQALYLQSVVDEGGQFRKFEKSFRARGLLWCTAMNEAMNDHLAQFVKGAHLLTAGAVIIVAIAAVPVAIMLNNLPSSPAATKIVGTVDVSSRELTNFRADLANVKKDMDALGKNKGSREEITALQKKVGSIESRLNKSQRTPGRKP